MEISVLLSDDDVWVTQAQLAEIYKTSKQNISHHILSIFSDGELDKTSTVKNYLTVQFEKGREVKRNLSYYVEFYQKFPEIFHSLSEKSTILSWTHYRALVRVLDDNVLSDDVLKVTGTNIDNIMPPMRRFGGGDRVQRKNALIEKLKAFFNKYFGLI